MPSCNDTVTAKMLSKQWKLQRDKSQLLGLLAWKTLSNSVSNMIGDAKGLLSTKALQETIDMIVDNTISNAMKNVSGYAIKGKDGITSLSSLGTILATLLTAPEEAYLGLAAFILSLLRYELERRVLLSELLLGELRNLRGILDFILNLGDRSDPNFLLSTQKAYEYINSATTLVGEAHSQLFNFNRFDNSKLTGAEQKLDLAKAELKTPIADAIRKVIEDRNFFGGTSLSQAINFSKDPINVYDDIKRNQGKDPSEVRAAAKAKAKANRATADENWDTLYTGLGAYLRTGNIMEVYIEMKELLFQVGKNIGRFLPLEPKQFLAINKELIPVGKRIVGDIRNERFNWDTVRDSAADMKGTMESRTLFSLNNTTRQKITNISEYATVWKGFKTLTSIILPLLTSTYTLLVNLRDDMGQYMSPTGTSVTGVNASVPAKSLNSRAGVSVKMSIWKQKISTIRTRLEAIETPADQIQGIGISYDNLDSVLGILTKIKEKYDDDNEFTPESEGTHRLIGDIVDQVFDSLMDPRRISDLKNTVSEAELSMRNSIAADKFLISRILTFTNSVLDIPGVSDAIKIVEDLLQKEKYQDDISAKLIEEIRNGNINLLINVSMASVAEISDGIAASKVAYAAVGSLYSDVKTCVQDWLNLGKAGEKSLKIDAEKIDAEVAEANTELDLAMKRIKKDQTKIDDENKVLSGVAKVSVDEEDILNLNDNVKTAYEDQERPTNEELLNSLGSV